MSRSEIPSPAITARDIHKSAGVGHARQPILRGVDLTVERGETLYLVGPSGSGKTTLLSILGCMLSPDQGEIHVLGEAIGRMSAEERTAFRKRAVGFIFQSFNLFPTLSALDNIRLALSVRGISLREASVRGSDLLARVGLTAQARLRPGQLSTGECQRVAVVRALAAEPALLFADEPTASLDAENGQAILTLLRGLARERRVTTVVVTHDERIFHFADRILSLDNGRLTREWRPRREESGA